MSPVRLAAERYSTATLRRPLKRPPRCDTVRNPTDRPSSMFRTRLSRHSDASQLVGRRPEVVRPFARRAEPHAVIEDRSAHRFAPRRIRPSGANRDPRPWLPGQFSRHCFDGHAGNMRNAFPSGIFYRSEKNWTRAVPHAFSAFPAAPYRSSVPPVGPVWAGAGPLPAVFVAAHVGGIGAGWQLAFKCDCHLPTKTPAGGLIGAGGPAATAPFAQLKCSRADRLESRNGR